MNQIWQSKKFILVFTWLIFTASLAGWWWVYGLNELYAPPSPPEEIARKYTMLFWEGLILVLMIVVAGGSLLFLLYKDHQRHFRLKLFFSTFTHDIKTSISRMSLQTQIFSEKFPQNHELQKLLESHHRLNLQLENALIFTQSDEPIRSVAFSLTKAIHHIRMEFPELKLKIEKDVMIKADERAMIMILRNLFQNSLIHGKATEIHMSAVAHPSDFAKISFKDNGQGFSGDIDILGQETLKYEKRDSNGLGLYLVKKVCEKMKGSVSFSSSENGFVVEINLPCSPMESPKKSLQETV